MSQSKRKFALFLVTAFLLIGGAVTYVVVAAGRADRSGAGATAAKATDDPTLKGTLLVRSVQPTTPGADGGISTVSLPSGSVVPTMGSLRCNRLYFAKGRGLCLRTGKTGVTSNATVIDAAGKVQKQIVLEGLPSRTRISPDGRYGAFTSFTSGDSYNSPGQFSTRTKIVEMASGKAVIEDLEQIKVVNKGTAITDPARNLWGVTFMQASDRFYATLATRGHHYLISGSVSEKKATVVRDRVECPSLSPDGKRIAFKSGTAPEWRIHVLDIASGQETAVAESNVVDDQVEWLDNERLVYGRSNGVWTVPAGGEGRPVLVVENASSPAVLR